ncbi:MAG TPA: hypothetical protein VIJ42_06395 [Stellaceae bacterium]
MKLTRNLGLGMALGTLTAAGALLAVAQPAAAQAPPGFFQVPGTQTSLLITGSVGTRFIGDFGNFGNPDQSGAGQIANDVLIPFLIPVRHEIGAGANNNGRFQSHFSNSDASFGFITNTPTAWGPLETVLILGTGNNGINSLFLNPAFPTTNVIVGFGSLGPFMAGLNGSLFGDSDADSEHIEPFGWVAGEVGALQPGFRYTWKGPGGFSIAGSAELGNSYGLAADSIGMWNNFFVSGQTNIGPAPVWNSSSLGGGATIPDLVLRARLDQPWGHITLAGILHNSSSSCSENCGGSADNFPGALGGGPVPNISALGGGINLSGHINTWGRDSLKAGFVWGQGLGSLMGEWGGNDGLVIGNNPNGTWSGASYLGEEWGVHAGYTHFWTDQLRSSVTVGYAAVTNNNPCGMGFCIPGTNGGPLANIFFDNSHFSLEGNLIWSPVPKVDLGVEYVYFQRNTQSSSIGWGTKGRDNRLSVESVFHF